MDYPTFSDYDSMCEKLEKLNIGSGSRIVHIVLQANNNDQMVSATFERGIHAYKWAQYGIRQGLQVQIFPSVLHTQDISK